MIASKINENNENFIYFDVDPSQWISTYLMYLMRRLLAM